jgi:hypothetical protein
MRFYIPTQNEDILRREEKRKKRKLMGPFVGEHDCPAQHSRRSKQKHSTATKSTWKASVSSGRVFVVRVKAARVFGPPNHEKEDKGAEKQQEQ